MGRLLYYHWWTLVVGLLKAHLTIKDDTTCVKILGFATQRIV